MRTRLGVLLFAFVLAVVAPMGRAEERVWTGVLLASNVKNPKEPPEQIAALYPRLQRVFKCNQFELFGSAMKVLDEQQEKWLVPSQNFWLGLNLQKEKPDEYAVDFQFYHDKRQLLVGKAKLGPDSPLFLCGPKHPRGKVVVVLMIQR